MVKSAVKNLTKIYSPNSKAVNNISFDIEENDFFVLLGPSGCGKSTTLRLIGGLETTSHGQIYLDGNDITNIMLVDAVQYTVYSINYFFRFSVSPS